MYSKLGEGKCAHVIMWKRKKKKGNGAAKRKVRKVLSYN
jgi:hypothetical protein